MTTLKRGIKYEITNLINENTATIFAKWIGCYTVIWNCKVAENQENYKNYLDSKQIGLSTLRLQPTQSVAHFITDERLWLKEVPSQIRRNAGSKYVEALNACLKGIRKAPHFKNKYDKRNCCITRELFQSNIKDNTIEFAFKRTQNSSPFCHFSVELNDKLKNTPKLVYITRKGARFWISWSYDLDPSHLRTEQGIINQLKQQTEEYQLQAVVGMDVGVVKPVALSHNQTFGFTINEEKSLAKKFKRRLRYQRALSRKKEMAKKNKRKLGKNYQKTKAKLSDRSAKIAHIRMNMAHRISKIIADETPEIVVSEKLRIKNMTQKPKAKQDLTTGKWLPNGARRKAGLNKSILNVAWGRIIKYTKYKLRERDKLLVEMPAAYSSQECFLCGYINRDNRLSQQEFKCLSCGHEDNADYNSSKVLKHRFLQQLRAGTFVLPTKTVKRIALRKQKAARTAVSVCGADIRPTLMGGGCEAKTSESDL